MINPRPKLQPYMELSPNIEQVRLHLIFVYTKKKITVQIITTTSKLTKEEFCQIQNYLSLRLYKLRQKQNN